MPERTRDPDFAWYRLQRREIAALVFIGAIAGGLAIWSWAKDAVFYDLPEHSQELPPARINVNTASAAELTALPGIGEAKAARIVDAREREPINSLDELADAAGGVPEKRLEQMKPYVVFE